MKDVNELYNFAIKSIVILLVVLIVMSVGAIFYEGIVNGGFNGIA